MDRHTILTALYNSNDLENLLSKVKPRHLKEDLKQEVFAVLCAMPEDKLLEIYSSRDSQGLRYYAIRVIMNMLVKKNHPFTKKYRNLFKHEVFRMDTDQGSAVSFNIIESVITNIPEEEDREDIEAMLKAIDKLSHYSREILILYANNGKSTIDISKQTTIPDRSIRHNLAKTRKAVKRHMRIIKKEQL